MCYFHLTRYRPCSHDIIGPLMKHCLHSEEQLEDAITYAKVEAAKNKRTELQDPRLYRRREPGEKQFTLWYCGRRMYCPEWIKDTPDPCPNCQYRRNSTNEGMSTKPPHMDGLKKHGGVTIAGKDMEKKRGNEFIFVGMQKRRKVLSGMVDESTATATANTSQEYHPQCNSPTHSPLPTTPHIDLERNSVVGVGQQGGDSTPSSTPQEYPQAGGLPLTKVVAPEAQRRCPFKSSPPRSDDVPTVPTSSSLSTPDVDSIDPILSELAEGESNATPLAIESNMIQDSHGASDYVVHVARCPGMEESQCRNVGN